jgi:fatty acid desaturase
MLRSEYANALKPFIPSEAFRPARYKLIWIGLYSTLALATLWMFARVNAWYLYAVLCLFQSFILASLAFLAHELSHASIIPGKRVRYLLELWQWGINLVPPTMWQKVHNQTHHTHAATIADPDRNFIATENCRSTAIYERLFYPQKSSPKFNPLIGFHFVPYVIRNIIAVFLGSKNKPTIVPAMPSYSQFDIFKIIFELVWIVALQIAIYLIVGSWQAYVFASPIAILCTSTIVMIYIFTNHWLNPITQIADPVVGSTSVIVPKFWNKMHFNFSYHTEHHVFPSLNSDYYPNVSEALAKLYPDRYNRMRLSHAWQLLWKLDRFSEHCLPRSQNEFGPKAGIQNTL